MKTVSSKDNSSLKAARKLLTRKGREESGAFLAEGHKLIGEAVSAGLVINCVFVNAGALARDEAVAGVYAEYADEVALEEKLFLDLSRTVAPQPYIAVVKKTPVSEIEALDISGSGLRRILILDRIGDPGNVGTMIRTALASGMDSVWCVKGTADAFSDKAIRASAGAAFRLPVREGLSAASCAERARAMDIELIVCSADGTNLYETRFSDRIAVVVGNESAGPQKTFLEAASRIVGIPMEDKSESLNAAVAAGIVMYEALRQRYNT